MGKELPCTVHSDGKTATGKALLETNEIVFRGDFRLKIPLGALQSVSTRNGALHLKWPDGSAVFELGANADKWAHKILHPKSTGEKLGIKSGLVISALAIGDKSFLDDLRTGAKAFSDRRAIGDSDLIFLGAETTDDLARVAKVTDSLAPSGALWIVYPKGRQEIKEQHVLVAGRNAGLVDVKVVGFSATHTALKFVRSKSKR
jgi:hypothetical protein